jgi:uncharacterized membrane protein YfcA
MLAALIVAAGLHSFHHSPTLPEAPAPAARHWPMLAAGVATGFVSGLTGVGGPVLAVPLLLAFGYPLLTAIGVGQVVQVAGAMSGTAANLAVGTIAFTLAAQVGAIETAGVLAGAALIHRIDLRHAQRCVAGLCVGAGLLFMLRGA